MYEWSKRSPQEMYSMEDTMRLWGHMLNPTPLTTGYKVNDNHSVNIHYDNMINVEGDVIDGERVTARMKKATREIAKEEIGKSWRKFGEGLRRY